MRRSKFLFGLSTACGSLGIVSLVNHDIFAGAVMFLISFVCVVGSVFAEKGGL